MQVGTARLLRDAFPGQHEHLMLQLDGVPELQFLYLQVQVRGRGKGRGRGEGEGEGWGWG